MIAGIPRDQRSMTDSLPAVLARRARSVSDVRLALDAGVGLVALAAASVVRPPGWTLVASAALCFACFGTWGIADRELSPGTAPGARRRLLLTLRAAAAGAGAVAALALGFGVLYSLLGTWIS